MGFDAVVVDVQGALGDLRRGPCTSLPPHQGQELWGNPRSGPPDRTSGPAVNSIRTIFLTAAIGDASGMRPVKIRDFTRPTWPARRRHPRLTSASARHEHHRQPQRPSNDYFIEDKYEAGLVLEGWEVKGIRAGRANIKESYVVIRRPRFHCRHAHHAAESASTHIHPDPTRTRKLLLHAEEIDQADRQVERAGYALVPSDLHLRAKGRVKVEPRSRQGQETVRQTRVREGTRLGAGEGAPDTHQGPTRRRPPDTCRICRGSCCPRRVAPRPAGSSASAG